MGGFGRSRARLAEPSTQRIRVRRRRRRRRGEGRALRDRRLPAPPREVPRAGRARPARRAADRPAGHGEDAPGACPRRRGRSAVLLGLRVGVRRALRRRGRLGVRDLFTKAKNAAPAIVFIDELDAIGARPQLPFQPAGGSEEREQTLNQILAELDGFDPSIGVIVLGATNQARRPRSRAAAGPGGSTATSPCNRRTRRGAPRSSRSTRGTRRSPTTSTSTGLASATSGIVGADLANVVNERRSSRRPGVNTTR